MTHNEGRRTEASLRSRRPTKSLLKLVLMVVAIIGAVVVLVALGSVLAMTVT